MTSSIHNAIYQKTSLHVYSQYDQWEWTDGDQSDRIQLPRDTDPEQHVLLITTSLKEIIMNQIKSTCIYKRYIQFLV